MLIKTIKNVWENVERQITPLLSIKAETYKAMISRNILNYKATLHSKYNTGIFLQKY